MELSTLARFQHILEEPGFEAGTIHPLEQVEPGIHSFAPIDYNPIVREFLEAVYSDDWVLSDFDWPTWAQTMEAKTLRDEPEALALATKEQLAWLITALVRADRYCEGALIDSFKSGLVLRIVRRAAQLIDQA